MDGFPGFISRDLRKKFPGREGSLNSEDQKEQTRGKFGRVGFQRRKESGNEGFQFLNLSCWNLSGPLSNPYFPSDPGFFIKGRRFGVCGGR
jgi:hypothetical protein